MCQTAKQAHINQINLKGRQVIVSSNRKTGSGAAVDFMHQSGIYQPLKSILVFTGSCTFFDNFVNEFFVFSCQLGRNGLPDHRDFRELTDIGMLCKVTLIGTNNTGKNFLHGRYITGLRPHQDGFGHATGDIVHLQFLIQRIEKSIGDRLNDIHTFQICSKVFVTIGNQKF